MAQTSEVRGVATTIQRDGNDTVVIYRGTQVVVWNDKRIRLTSNGWMTNTTKLRMNQASNQFGLGYSVSQKDYTWYVRLPSGETVRFSDGMVFDRIAP